MENTYPGMSLLATEDVFSSQNTKQGRKHIETMTPYSSIVKIVYLELEAI